MEPSRRNIAMVASIVFICLSILGGVIAFLCRNTFVPKIIDGIFGVSPYVLKEISRRIDSGYSDTFIFAMDLPNKDGKILFFAEKGQTVRITIRGYFLGEKPSKMRMFIDNGPWGGTRKLPLNIVHGDITEKLKFDEPGADIHVLRIVPEGLEKDALMVVDALVLVYNK